MKCFFRKLKDQIDEVERVKTEAREYFEKKKVELKEDDKTQVKDEMSALRGVNYNLSVKLSKKEQAQKEEIEQLKIVAQNKWTK